MDKVIALFDAKRDIGIKWKSVHKSKANKP